MQAYARPFESDLVDTLQTAAYSAHFIFLFLGLLFDTGDLREIQLCRACAFYLLVIVNQFMQAFGSGRKRRKRPA